MLDWIRLQLGRRHFNRRRDGYYLTMATDLEQPGTKETVLDVDRFDDWAQRAAERHLPIAVVHHTIQRRLRTGMKLSKAVSPVVPVEDVLVLDSGESAGQLAPALRSAIKIKKAVDSMRGMVLLSLAAPLLCAANVAALTMINGKVVFPDFLRSFPLRLWDAWCVPGIKGTLWMAEHWWLFAVPAILAVLYLRSLRTWTGPIRQYLDRFPPYNAHRDKTAATLVQVIGALMASRLTLDGALARVQTHADRYTAWHVARMRQNLKLHGSDLVKVFDTGLFATDLLDQIADAAKTRVFDEALKHLSGDALEGLVQAVKWRAMISSGIIMLVFASLYFYIAAILILGVDNAGNRRAAEARGATVSQKY
ncbi:hypothetical protein [Cupriavidus pauculus]|uniref:hypothetical protein n=1 Tax=Cupriavidus pauculus TaxID=82633 RepID=UPI00385784E0